MDPSAPLLDAAAKLSANLSALHVDWRRSLSNVGNAALLREKLSTRCLSSQPTRNNITILVTGGSMSAGSMNCYAKMHVLCAGKFVSKRLRWARALHLYLQSAFPRCDFLFKHHFHPASTSSIVFRDSYLTSRADIVIEDYTINDVKGKEVIRGRITDDNALNQTIGAHEFFVLEHRLQRATVIFMEAFPGFHMPLRCVPYLEHVHTTVARAYAIPVLSFMRAICNESAVASASAAPAAEHWRAGCGKLDARGLECAPHPGPHTHRIYAGLLAMYIMQQGITATTVRQDMLAQVEEAAAPSGRGPFVLHERQLNRLRACTHIASVVDTGTSCMKRKHHIQTNGWQCYADKPGKPGWIVNSSQTAARQLSIPMRASWTGYLIAGFLRSYEGMGRVSVFVDGNTSMAHTLDGAWRENSSQTDFVVIPMVDLVYSTKAHPKLGSNHHPSMHLVTLQSPSLDDTAEMLGAQTKFKLTYLATC